MYRKDSTRQFTRRSYMESSHPPFPPPPTIQHERLKEVYASLPDEQISMSFPKSEHTDLARFHSGYHPTLQRCQHLVGVSENAVCRLCGEEVKSADHVWLRCPTLLVERHHSDLRHMMDKLFCLPCAALALLGSSSDSRGNQQQHQHSWTFEA